MSDEPFPYASEGLLDVLDELQGAATTALGEWHISQYPTTEDERSAVLYLTVATKKARAALDDVLALDAPSVARHFEWNSFAFGGEVCINPDDGAYWAKLTIFDRRYGKSRSGPIELAELDRLIAHLSALRRWTHDLQAEPSGSSTGRLDTTNPQPKPEESEA